MEVVNGVSDGGPPPPSPLTGCYLLIVIGEPHSQEHKDIILRRVAKGLLSWDLSDCMVDLEKELAIITEQAPEGEEARYGERLIQYASENLVTEVLIHPAVSTLSQCVRNLLSSFTRHRHIIHSGYTFASNGSWALQDGTFSLADFSEAFQELDVQRVNRAYDNGISVDIHCSPEGDWTRLPKEPFAKNCKVRLNPVDVMSSSSPAIADFLNYITPFLIPLDIVTALESSEVVGNIRFSHPTLYVFPGGQGDAALFGINGFNMLLDGGFSRKACFWDFVRHLDRLDAVLLTRLNNSNVSGITSVLKRKRQNAVYPQIGHFFCNIQERKALLSPDGDKDRDPLLINLLEEGHDIVTNLKHLSLHPQTCYRDSDPINLYHKVGHGTLDMYVLSPAKDSREVREFIQKWNNQDSRLFANPKTKDFSFPLPNLVSICALLVWQPSNSSENITRILFPGSTPQSKIFEGLDRLKQLDCIKYPICSENSLNPPKKSKEQILDSSRVSQKILPDVKKERSPRLNDVKPREPSKPSQTDNKNSDAPEIKKEIKKSDSTDSDKSTTKPSNKMESKPIKDTTATRTPRVRDKESKSIERKTAPKIEKKSSPTTPKKSLANGDATKPKTKLSPSATPAKSAKEATNRKVHESKKQTPRKDPKPAEKEKEKKEPEKKVERKPISRRPKAAAAPTSAPAAKPATGSPIRKKPDSIAKKAKLDKEGTTDSSTVSTPTADADAKRDITKLSPEELDQLKAQELADLQEEQEVVQEIEAVFRKGEEREASESEMRKIKNISIEEKTDEEYLIVEKVEVQEDEIQKITRDSEESEKQRKLSEPKIEEAVKEVISPEEKVDKVESATQPDEKFSATVESGATTAPTLPEDERIPLDEIKEKDDTQIIEEKHVKEDTKEKESIPVIQLPLKSVDTPPVKVPPVVGIRLDKQQHIRDIVKTPDEVADLPVHEVADHYVDYQKTTDEQTITVVKENIQEVKSDVEIVTQVGKEEVGAVVDEIIEESKEIVDKGKEHIKEEAEVGDEAVKDIADKVEVVKDEENAEEDAVEEGEKPVEDVLVESKMAVQETISEVQKTAVDIDTEIRVEVIETKELVDEQINELEENAGEVKEDIESKLEETKKDVVEVKEAIADVVKEATADAENLTEKLDESKDAVEGILTEGASAIAENEKLDATKENVKELADATEKEVDEVEEVAKDIVGDIRQTAADLSHDITKDVEEKKETLEEAVDQIETTEDEVEEQIETKVDEVKETLDDVKKIVSGKVEEKQDKIDDIAEAIEEQVEAADDIVKDMKTEALEVISHAITSTEDVKELIGKEDDEIKETTTEKVKDAVNETIEESKHVVEQVVSDVHESAATKMSEVLIAVEETKEQITEIKTAVTEKVEEIKESVTEKVKETVQETIEKVTEIKESVAAKAEEATKAAEELITTTREELTDTVDEKLQKEARNLKDLQKTVEDNAKEAISNVEQSSEQIKSTIVDETEASINAVKESITETVAKAETAKEVIQESITESVAEGKEQHDVIISEVKSEISKVSEKISETKESIVSEVKENVDDVKSAVTQKAESIGGFFSKTFSKLEETTKAIGEKLSEEVGKVIGETKVEQEEIKEKGQAETETGNVETSIIVESVDADHPEVINVKESPDSPSPSPFDFIDKTDLGRKSPKEREQDVAKIVASVAEVLKSEAPLEDFKGKIPLEITTYPTFTPYTTELRETHITTVDSPITDMPGQITPIKEEKIDEVLKEMEDDFDSNSNKSKISDLIKTSNELLEASSKMISGIKERKEEEEDEEEDEQVDTGTVHRMLVTASSEDGGEETVICPPGSITFSKSAEGSERSSPDLRKDYDIKQQDTPSPESSQEQPSVLQKEPEISAKMLSEDIPEKKDKVDDDVKKPELLVEYEDNKEAEKKLQAEEVVSGKATSEISKSGKSTPEPKSLSGKATPETTSLSEKASPEPRALSGEATSEPEKLGKVTPEPAIITDKASAESTKSGKSTPEPIVESGKRTPEPAVDLEKPITAVPEPRILSGNATPELSALSGKATPEPTALSGKLASETTTLSEKGTPELAVLSGKVTPEPTVISGKTTPEPPTLSDKSERKDSSREPTPKPEVQSDKHTPEPVVLSGKVTPESKQLSGKATPEPSPTTEDIKSGKATPDIAKSGKATPDIVKSGKSTPDVPKSGKSTPDIHDAEVITEASEKSNLDVKDSTTSNAEVASKPLGSKSASISGKSTPVQKDDSHQISSGKSTPDLNKKPISGKSTPDEGINGKISPEAGITNNETVSSIDSGKASPETGIFISEILEEATKTEITSDSTTSVETSVTHSEKRKQSITSTTTAVSQETVSGKSTPEVPKSGTESPITCCRRPMDNEAPPQYTAEDMMDGLGSARSSPELNNISGKSTPDIAKSPSVSPAYAQIPVSGKGTPDVSKSGKSSPDFGKGDSIKLDTDSLASGKATPDINVDLQSSIAPQMDTDSLASWKITPDLKHDLSSSEVDKHSTQIETDSLASGKITPDVHKLDASGKATPEVQTASGKSSPDIRKDSLPTSKKSSVQIDEKIELSGKSTPDLPKDKKEDAEEKEVLVKSPEIGNLVEKLSSDEEAKDGLHIDEPSLSGKSTPDVHSSSKRGSLVTDEKAASGKTTPDLHKDESLAAKKDSVQIEESLKIDVADVMAVSGKSTPDLKGTDTIESRKDSIKLDDVKSGKSTPEILSEILSRKQSIAIDSAHQSGKATPEPVTMENGNLHSGKTTPDHDIIDAKDCLHITEAKLASSAADIETKITDVYISGKSTPDIKADSRKQSVHMEDEKLSTDELTSDLGQKEYVARVSDIDVCMKQETKSDLDVSEAKSDKMASGKSTPDVGKLETMTIEDIQSGKTTPDVQKGEKHDLSKPESVQLVSGKSTPAPSGKSTPVSPDHQNGQSRDSIPSGKSTPGLSGKVTPEPDVSSGKITPDLNSDVVLSGKSTPDLKQDLKALSGKSTPDSGFNGASLTTITSNTLQSSTAVETLKKEIKSHSLSGTQSPDFSKRSSIQVEHILSGKTTPDHSKSSQVEQQHSGKSTPDFGKRGSMQAEHILSGKSTPDFIAGSGQATPEPTNKTTISLSGQSTPRTGKTSPDVHLSEVQGQTITEVSEVTSSFDVSQLQSAHVFRELMQETIVSSLDEKTSINGDVIHEKHETIKLDSVKEALSGKSTPDLPKDSRKSSVLSAADDSDYRKFSITSENTKTSSAISGKSTPDIKEEQKHTVQAFIDAERQLESTPSPSKSTVESTTAAGFHALDPMATSFYGALPDDDDDDDIEEDVAGVVLRQGADLMTSSFIGELPSDDKAEEVVKSWGKPLGLPSPAPPADNKGTPKKEKRLPVNVSVKNKLNQRSESPSKKKKINPIYVDLTYVPHHGNSYYSQVDFFKRVRARYYVFSGIEPSKEVYNALLEAKQTWEDKDLEVTIIPTYDTDVLGYWVAENEELLTKFKIDLSPSASRCTINLQDHETSCSAYRLEF